MKIAVMALTLIAAMSISSYAGGYYNAAAAYGACQEDGLRGVHYALEGDCPNWETWKTQHVKAQNLPRRHVYPTPTRKSHLRQ